MTRACSAWMRFRKPERNLVSTPSPAPAASPISSTRPVLPAGRKVFGSRITAWSTQLWLAPRTIRNRRKRFCCSRRLPLTVRWRESFGRWRRVGRWCLPPDRRKWDLNELSGLIRKHQRIALAVRAIAVQNDSRIPAKEQDLAPLRAAIVAGEACPTDLIEEHYSAGAARVSVQRVRTDRGDGLVFRATSASAKPNSARVPIGRPDCEYSDLRTGFADRSSCRPEFAANFTLAAPGSVPDI